MVLPTNLPELRMTLGVFVQSSQFIPQYAHIVRPLTELTRSDKGKPVPYVWTPERQQSYDHICNLLLDGIHLAPPDYRLPFHSGGDASNDGKSYGIHQFCDLPRGTQFSVTAHTPTQTTVRLADTNTLHTPSPTPTTHAATLHGSQRLGLKQIGNGLHFTLKLTRFFGASLNAASGLCRPHSRSTPPAITCR
jgi:hypothetical protein